MRVIAKTIQDFLLSHYKCDKTVDVRPFNNCVFLTYLEGMKINEHCDICYTAKGQYHTSSNSQMEKTITAILVVGDTHQLRFHLYSQGNTMKKIADAEHCFDLRHGTLLLLHPEDE